MNKMIAAILLAMPVISEAADYTSFVANWEGYSPVAYQDSRGYTTIGYGINISDKGADTLLSGFGLSAAKLRSGQKITSKTARALLQQSVAMSVVTAREEFPNFDSHSLEVRKVLVDFCYNLGPNKVPLFKNFKAAIAKRDYASAAYHLKQSKWYTQVGRRSKNHVATLAALGKR